MNKEILAALNRAIEEVKETVHLSLEEREAWERAEQDFAAAPDDPVEPKKPTALHMSILQNAVAYGEKKIKSLNDCLLKLDNAINAPDEAASTLTNQSHA